MGFHQPHGAGEAGIEAVEATERDQWLRVGCGAGLVVDEDRGDIERHRHAEARARGCGVRSKVGEAPPLVKTRPVDDVAIGPHVNAGECDGKVLHVLPVGGGVAALQQAGAGEQPGACLDAADGARAARGARRKAATRAGDSSRVPKPPMATSTSAREAGSKVPETATGRPQVVAGGAPSGETMRQSNTAAAGDAVGGAKRVYGRGHARACGGPAGRAASARAARGRRRSGVRFSACVFRKM